MPKSTPAHKTNSSKGELILIEDVRVLLFRKSIRHSYIGIHPPHGEVRVTCPARTSRAEVVAFISEKLSWIRKHKYSLQRILPETPFKFQNGERHFYFGKAHTLNVFLGNHRLAYFHPETDSIRLVCREADSTERRAAVVYKMYFSKLKEVLTILLPKWCTRLGLPLPQFQIRSMKSRWGSCHTNRNKIVMNLELVKYDLSLIEYVLVHELVHFKAPNHGPNFKQLMTEYLPDWKVRLDSLKRGIKS